MGRKLVYDKNVHPKIAKSLAKQGLIEIQIAEAMEINWNTLYSWKKRYAEFDKALKEGKAFPDARVVDSLYQRAIGYEYEELEYRPEKIKYPLDKDGNPKRPKGKPTAPRFYVSKKTVKRVLPDVTAQIFWLKNRLPKEWRDRQEMDLSGQINTNVAVAAAEMSPEEREKWIKDHGYIKKNQEEKK